MVPGHYDVHRALSTGLAFKEGFPLVLPSSRRATAKFPPLSGYQNCSSLNAGVISNAICCHNVVNKQSQSMKDHTVLQHCNTNHSENGVNSNRKTRLRSTCLWMVLRQVAIVMLRIVKFRIFVLRLRILLFECNVRVEFKQ